MRRLGWLVLSLLALWSFLRFYAFLHNVLDVFLVQFLVSQIADLVLFGVCADIFILLSIYSFYKALFEKG
jgi:hypothetical protein